MTKIFILLILYLFFWILYSPWISYISMFFLSKILQIDNISNSYFFGLYMLLEFWKLFSFLYLGNVLWIFLVEKSFWDSSSKIFLDILYIILISFPFVFFVFLTLTPFFGLETLLILAILWILIIVPGLIPSVLTRMIFREKAK